MRRRGFLARWISLWHGFWGLRLRNAEAGQAEAVYHQAIERRAAQHRNLKDAVSRLVYLRNRLDSDLRQRQDDLQVVTAALMKAAREDNDARALGLIRKKRTLEAEVTRLESEYERLHQQAQQAKESLGEVSQAVQKLKAERDEMLARKQHALSQLEIKSALESTSAAPGSADAALESVREAITRLEVEADLDPETLAPEAEVSLQDLRLEAESDADRATLAQLKVKLGQRGLPAHAQTEPWSATPIAHPIEVTS